MDVPNHLPRLVEKLQTACLVEMLRPGLLQGQLESVGIASFPVLLSIIVFICNVISLLGGDRAH